MKNITSALGTGDFCRVRIGIGKRPEYMDMADYVLSRFNKEDREQVEAAQKEACRAVVDIISDGIDRAMNRYN